MISGNKYRDINCYELLGVAEGSSIQEIKSAFRKISMETHPDRGGSNEAQARINYAYEILSDPARRRRHDKDLSAIAAEASRNKRHKSKHAEDWEKSFRKNKGTKSFKDRVREAVNQKSEEIRSGHSLRVDALNADICRVFKTIRGRFIFSAAAACILLAAGFVYPVLWAGVIVPAYAMLRNYRCGDGKDAVFVLNPEWKYTIKKHARRKVKLESEALRAHLDDISECVTLLYNVLRKTSGIKDDEGTVLRRIVIHFFMLGYAPLTHDEEARIVLLSDGEEKIAVRYRQRAGNPVNAAFIKTLYEYMLANDIQKGYLFAAPGLSGNAAKMAERDGIAHYSIREMNAWIGRMTSGQYPGPGGDIIVHIDSLMKFLQRI